MNWTDKGDGEYLYAAEINAVAAAVNTAETNASTALNRANAAQAATQALTQYSTTPQQVGTWIDDTPVWRWAFSYKFTDYFANETAYNLFKNEDKYIDVLLPIREYRPRTIYIDVSGTYTRDVENPNFVDDFALPARGRNIYFNDIISQLPTWANLANHGFYGWIEFATPVSNIITS